jgi:hypothetical protein
MPSTKQEALADLMHWLICLSRGPQSYGFFKRLFRRRDYQRVLDDLYLIHKIPLSILDSEFTRNDLDFLNWGVSSYVAKVGHGIDSRTASNLISVFDAVPDELQDEVRWSPPDWLVAIAKQNSNNHPEANTAAQTTASSSSGL